MHALRELGDLTASQWGMVTTAQAAARGVTRLQLSRLAEDGHLERIAYGIYRDAGTPPERYDSLKAAWLSINPRRTALDRLADKPPDAVVSGATASYLLGLGDLAPEPYELTVPRRRQTQRAELTFRVRQLPTGSLTRREGLPVTTPEQTIADLVQARLDLSLVAGVLSEAEALDSARLADLLSPLASRNGFKRGDGQGFLAELERLAHRDVDSLARAVSATPLARRIAEEYLKTVDLTALVAPLSSMIGEALAKSGLLSQAQEPMKAIVPRLVIPQENLLNLLPAVRSLQEALAHLPVQQLAMDDRLRKQLISMAEQMRHAQQATTEGALTTKAEDESEAS